MSEDFKQIDCVKILSMLPHRYPLLLVDKVVDFEADKTMTSIKNVTFNEPHFCGHFPAKPIMPGVLIVEAIAQTAAIFAMHSLGVESEGKLVYFMSIDNAKFRKPVVPGDVLNIKVQKEQCRGNIWKFSGKVTVEGKKVAEAVVTAMIVNEEK